MKKFLIVAMVCSLALVSISCKDIEREIQDSQDALPVIEPGNNALPKDVLIPEESVYTQEELAALNTTQIKWGPGSETNEAGCPQACVSLQQQYEKYAALFLGPDREKVYLTFDEGYENGYTASILDTLSEKQVRAVFFVTMDYVKREPELVQRMIEEGHTVGNHTTHHPNMTTLSLEEAREEVQELHEYVKEQFGYEMSLFRAPEGAISEQSMALLSTMGYHNVLWSFAYADWDPKKQMNPSEALQRVCDRAHPGAIYLLHAVSQTNAEILGQMIDTVRSQGFEFGSLEEELP